MVLEAGSRLCLWPPYPRPVSALTRPVGQRGLGGFCLADGCLGPVGGLLPADQHQVGKAPVQRLECKHLTLRTRLKRLTQPQALLDLCKVQRTALGNHRHARCQSPRPDPVSEEALTQELDHLNQRLAARLLRQAWALLVHQRDFGPSFHLKFVS